MASSREALLAKLNALRARAEQSTNVNEAAASAAIFAKLIVEHRVSDAELKAATPNTAAADADGDIPEAIDFVVQWRDGDRPDWLHNLAHFLAGEYGCASITDFREEAGIEGVTLQGSAADVEAVRYMIVYLSLEIARLSVEATPQRLTSERGRANWRDDFCTGAAAAIQKAMKKARKEVAQSPAVSSALAARAQSASATLAERFGDDIQTCTSKTEARSRDAFDKGKRAGKGLAGERAKGIASGTGPKLLKG